MKHTNHRKGTNFVIVQFSFSGCLIFSFETKSTLDATGSNTIRVCRGVL